MKLALAIGALALIACGGKVVFVEDDGADGGGSSSPSPSSGAGTEKFEPGPQPDPRGDLCAAYCPASCGLDCFDECFEQFFGAGCDSISADVVQCFGDSVDPQTCSFFGSCEQELDEWTKCPMNLCSDGCSLAEQDCSCLRTCDDRDLQMNCNLVADAQASCDCKIDGVTVTTCTETHLACDLDFGCCAAAFGF